MLHRYNASQTVWALGGLDIKWSYLLGTVDTVMMISGAPFSRSQWIGAKTVVIPRGMEFGLHLAEVFHLSPIPSTRTN